MYKRTSPYVISLLLASANTVHIQKTGRGHLSGKGNTKDIGESDVDPWVYDKVSDAVEYDALRNRAAEPPAVNTYWVDNFVPPELKGLNTTKALA